MSSGAPKPAPAPERTAWWLHLPMVVYFLLLIGVVAWGVKVANELPPFMESPL